MSDKSAIGVLSTAVRDAVTTLTECGPITHVQSSRKVRTERPDVMSVECTAPPFATPLAGVVIPFKDRLSPGVVRGGLTFPANTGCNAATPIRIVRATTSHGHTLARLRRVSLAKHMLVPRLPAVIARSAATLEAAAVQSIRLVPVSPEVGPGVPNVTGVAPFFCRIQMRSILRRIHPEDPSGTGDKSLVHISIVSHRAGGSHVG